ncbi:MAG TPA: (2Fe-2S)-binding protein [Abditibacteriaceae bacterium]
MAMVTRCVCFAVRFTQIKQLIDTHGIRDIDELRTYIRFGEKCCFCVPYVEQIFLTGETAFELLPVDE